MSELGVTTKTFTRLCRRMRMFLALGVLFAVTPLAAAPFGLSEGEAEVRMAPLEDGFEILMLKDSYVLQPREEERGFQFLELREDGLLVDGEKLSDRELRRRLGEDLSLILPLLEKPPEAAEPVESVAGPQTPEPVEVEAPEAPEPPEVAPAPEVKREAARSGRSRHRSGARVSFGSDRHVGSEESVEEVVVIGGGLSLDGEVRSNAVAIGGNVRVDGEVGDSVVAVGGNVILGPEAEVRGDVVSIMGRVERHRDSRVRGEVSEVSFGSGAIRPTGDWPRLDWDDDWDFSWWTPFWKIFTSSCLAIVLLFLVLVAGDLVREVSERIDREPWKAGLVGFVSQILFVPLSVLVVLFLLISVIGIPLLLLLVPMALVGVLVVELLGYAGVSRSLGSWTRSRFDWPAMGPYVLVLVGLIMLQGWTIAGEFLSLTWGPIKLTGWLLILVGFLLKYIGWTLGLGGVLLRVFAPGLPAPSGLPPLPPPAPGTPPPVAPVGEDSGPHDEGSYDTVSYDKDPRDPDLQDEEPWEPETGEFSDLDTDTLDTESTDPWFGDDEDEEPDAEARSEDPSRRDPSDDG